MPHRTQIVSGISAARGAAPSFVVGRNSAGQWLAVEDDGSGGGVFVSREAAARYALVQSDRRPDAVRFAAGTIELRF